MEEKKVVVKSYTFRKSKKSEYGWEVGKEIWVERIEREVEPEQKESDNDGLC